MRRVAISDNDLRRFYVDERATIKQIARTFNCAPTTIRRRLVSMNVGIRRSGWNYTKRFFPQTVHVPDSPAKLAYLAGIIDGEGTIDFIKNKTRRRREVAPRLKVVNTDFGLIKWLAELGGRFYRYERKDRRHKPSYEWFISGVQNIQPLLQAILPYLVIKRRNAERVLEFCRIEVEKRVTQNCTFSIPKGILSPE